jgi:hypothetical protein
MSTLSENDFMAQLLGDLTADVFSDPVSSQKSSVLTPVRKPLSQKTLNRRNLVTPLKSAKKRPVKHVALEIRPYLPAVQPDTLDTLCDGVEWSDFDAEMEEPEILPKVSSRCYCLILLMCPCSLL